MISGKLDNLSALMSMVKWILSDIPFIKRITSLCMYVYVCIKHMSTHFYVHM